jgi:hypothetical protein
MRRVVETPNPCKPTFSGFVWVRPIKRSFDETGLNRLIGETLRVAEEQRCDREAAISSAIRNA